MYNRNKKSYELTKKTALLMCTLFACTMLVSCRKFMVKKNSNTYEPISFIEYDYTLYEMTIIEMQRFDKLMDDNGLTEYTQDGKVRNYDYTVDDYRQMEGLDESYISCFSSMTNEKTINEVLKVFGYNNLEEYVRAKGFVDDKGNVDIVSWHINCLNELGYKLRQEANENKTE